MINIDDQYVTSAAPNIDAAKNGRALVLKKKFIALNISEDQTLLFGQCQGSGKSPYECSSDFAKPESPTHRCNCPSRQFPCKHCVGLMYAYTQNAAAFKVADVPEDLQSKREKAEAKAEKKKVESAKPKQVNKAALAKKIKAQMDGLDLLERLTQSLVSIGIGNMNEKSVQQIDEQAKQLGDAYLPGAQAALRAYTGLFCDSNGYFEDDRTPAEREQVYGEALDKLSTLYALIKQGRAYLEKRLSDPELKPDIETSIAAWLGHAWQLAELREAGLMTPNVEMMQLAFNCCDDRSRQEFIDSGIWIDLASGKLYCTKNYRPYKAAKFIKAEDSFFQVAQIPELFIYPGDMNQRIRWEGMTTRPTIDKDFAAIKKFAQADFAAMAKQVKGNLKGPLSEKQPVCLLKFKRIGMVEETLCVEDVSGNRLTMTDRGIAEEPPSLQLLRLVPSESLVDQVLIARFRHDFDTKRLEVKPLAIVTSNDVVRLTL